jgi:hypothetical protein
VALCDGGYMEELRRHPVYSSLFQQRSSPQFGSARSKARARRQRNAYRSWLELTAAGPGCRPAARASVPTRASHQRSGRCGWRSERSGRSPPWLLQGYRLHASQSAVSGTEPSDNNRTKEQSNRV